MRRGTFILRTRKAIMFAGSPPPESFRPSPDVRCTATWPILTATWIFTCTAIPAMAVRPRAGCWGALTAWPSIRISTYYVADSPNGAVRVLKPSPIANAGSMLAGPIAAGEVVTLFGVGLGPEELVINPPDSTGAVSTEVGGTQVFFHGVAVPVI